MYTAVVLVCFIGASINSETCFTYTHYHIFETKAECKSVIKEFIVNDYANNITINETEKVKVEDYYCINWSEQNL